MSAPYATAHVSGESGVDAIEELAREHPGLVVIARAGWVAKGIVYGLVGVLALPIARDSRRGSGAASEEASQSGAIAKIAESSAGAAVLWTVAIGLGLYVLWRVVSILLPADNSAKTWANRAGYAVSAFVYTALALSAISFASNGSRASKTENSRVEKFTSDLMGHNGGRWLVGLVGALLIAVAGFFVHKGVTANFRKELREAGVGPISTKQVVRIGQVGWCARAAMMALLGFFLIRAAVQFSPDEAEGLDGALRRLAAESWGTAMVLAIGVGLLIYGLFCVISAPIQRLRGAS